MLRNVFSMSIGTALLLLPGCAASGSGISGQASSEEPGSILTDSGCGSGSATSSDCSNVQNAQASGSADTLVSGSWQNNPIITQDWYCGPKQGVGTWSLRSCVIQVDGIVRTAVVVENLSKVVSAATVSTAAQEKGVTYQCDAENVNAASQGACFGKTFQTASYTQVTAVARLLDLDQVLATVEYTLPLTNSATDTATATDSSTSSSSSSVATGADVNTQTDSSIGTSTSTDTDTTAGGNTDPSTDPLTGSSGSDANSSTNTVTAAVAVGTWRPSASTSITSAWHCGTTLDHSLWSAQNCVIVQSGSYQSAIVVRNRSQALASVSARTKIVGNGIVYQCPSSGVAASNYSVCFGATRSVPAGTTELTAQGAMIFGAESVAPASVTF